MHLALRAAAITALVLGSAHFAPANVTFDFEDGTDQGFGTGFGDDASKSFTVANVAGSMRMLVPRTGGFQEAGRQAGADGSPFYNTMLAASADEANYVLSYDYYIDTANWGADAGTFFQLGTYVNTGNGYYAQNFGTPKEVELNGDQLASGQVFSGTVSQTFAAKGFDMPPGQTFFRIGLIENGNGAAQAVYFDNISIIAIPEPATLSLSALATTALLARRRRA